MKNRQFSTSDFMRENSAYCVHPAPWRPRKFKFVGEMRIKG